MLVKNITNVLESAVGTWAWRYLSQNSVEVFPGERLERDGWHNHTEARRYRIDIYYVILQDIVKDCGTLDRLNTIGIDLQNKIKRRILNIKEPRGVQDYFSYLIGTDNNYYFYDLSRNSYCMYDNDEALKYDDDGRLILLGTDRITFSNLEGSASKFLADITAKALYAKVTQVNNYTAWEKLMMLKRCIALTQRAVGNTHNPACKLSPTQYNDAQVRFKNFLKEVLINDIYY